MLKNHNWWDPQGVSISSHHFPTNPWNHSRAMRRRILLYVVLLQLLPNTNVLVQGGLIIRYSGCRHPSPTTHRQQQRQTTSGSVTDSTIHLSRRSLQHYQTTGCCRYRNDFTRTTAFSHHPAPCMMMAIISDDIPFQILLSDAAVQQQPSTVTSHAMTILKDNNNNNIDSIGMLSKETTILVFIIGVIPFIIATYEFWRRIAVGATFGTGNDSVVFPTTTIGNDNDPTSSRGKQILGQDSLITAYIIFTTVAIVLGIVLYAVVTSPIPS